MTQESIHLILLKKLTDYSDFNLYKMDICYDYSIDKIIDRGIFDDESALGAIVQEVLPDYPSILKCRISGAVPLQ